MSRRFNASGRIVGAKLDVLDYLETVPVCVGYRFKRATLDWMHAISEEYAEVEPVYQELPGWSSPTTGINEFERLPGAAKDCVAFLEDRLEIEIGGVWTGPKRAETIIREGTVLERVTAPQDIAGAEVARTEVQANPKIVLDGIGWGGSCESATVAKGVVVNLHAGSAACDVSIGSQAVRSAPPPVCKSALAGGLTSTR